jgi:ATP-dependent DNA ligase
MQYIKAKNYNGKPLKGLWVFSRKIDGVRAFIHPDGTAMSRAGKPLYNLGHLATDVVQDVEVFLGSWEATVSKVRSHIPNPVPRECVYSLDPLDIRLKIGTVIDPSPELIFDLMQREVDFGHEGIVLRQGQKWIKVKPLETYDVEVIGIQPGTGKHEGRMGALLTPMGKVGTGFTAQQREELNNPLIIGELIEVECMSLTPSGKFRHPRFVRFRFDK